MQSIKGGGMRRGDEHHVGEIVVDLEIMVLEGVVLLGVEHFQQGRRRDRQAYPRKPGLPGLRHLINKAELMKGPMGAAV